jgi:hypothetical protein
MKLAERRTVTMSLGGLPLLWSLRIPVSVKLPESLKILLLVVCAAFSWSACTDLPATKSPAPPVVLGPQRPFGVPLSRRVHRRPGRLGPQGGLLGLERRFEYPAVPLVYHPEVQAYVEKYSHGSRAFLAEALPRRARYLPVMEEIFERYHVPVALINMVFVESRFIPHARSADGTTVGLWQLSAATARNYGLTVNKKVDERTDVRKSTEAAARFLSSLYDTFGDWYLAAAAWNSGPVRVQKALDDALAGHPLDSLDVFELTAKGLVCETTRQFVAKLGAIVIISKDFEKYGFDVPPPEPKAEAPSGRSAGGPTAGRVEKRVPKTVPITIGREFDPERPSLSSGTKAGSRPSRRER